MKKFSKYLSMLLVTFAVFAVIGCASTESRSGTGEFFDDSVITTKVKAAIFQDEDLKVLEISVKTYKGIVQLSGFVSSNAAAQKAVMVAGSVQGVKSVKNDMQIK